MQVAIIILLILAVLLVIFTLQNSIEISIQFFFWEIQDAPLVLVLLCCLFLGYIIGAIYFYPRLWKLNKEYKKLIRFNKELKELHKMNHPEDVRPDEVIDPEGIELDDSDDDDKPFFRD